MKTEFDKRLISLLDKYAITRQKVHDMNIAATMLDNDIRHLVTFNHDDLNIRGSCKNHNSMKIGQASCLTK